MDKLNEIMKGLFAQFADKNETKKKFASIDKNIKNLFELLMAQGQN